LGIDSGQQLMFRVNFKSDNHSFNKWVFEDDNGNIFRQSTASGYGFTLLSGNTHATAYLSYTPINYTISGTVRRKDGSLVPGGVELSLSSSEQTINKISTDGTFSFTGVKGGVSVTITPSSADGYAFSPSKMVFNNLKSDQTGKHFTAYSFDENVPVTSFNAVPPEVSTDSSVNFSWTGVDDVTPSGSLLYQYKLDGVDVDWSSWTSATSKAYDLPNGTYTFWVRAKDEAENIDQAPISHTFVVNAAPMVLYAERTDISVWASRITLEMPVGATQPTNSFIILPQHSGMIDSELVPIRIHRVDDSDAIGANEIVAGALGLVARIVKADKGWLVTLPDNIPSGQPVQYDIVWGKIKYFGWQDYVNIPSTFRNGAAVKSSYLDDDLNLWRNGSKLYRRTVFSCDRDAWIYMDAGNQEIKIKEEKVLRFAPGECTGAVSSGPRGDMSAYESFNILNSNDYLLYTFTERREIWDGAWHHSKYRYGLDVFDLRGNLLNTIDGNFSDDSIYTAKLVNGSLW
jgi:hypothetical protein